MKKIFSLLAIVLSLTCAGQGQPNKGGRMQAEGQMLEKLNLTEAQQAKINKLNADFRANMQELKADENLSESELMSRRRTLVDDRRKAILAVLTPEQKAQFEAALPERGSRFDIEEYRAALGLSDEQYNKLKELIEAGLEKEKSLMQGSDISPEQRRQYLDAMNKNKMEILKTILTPSQMEKLQQMNARGQGSEAVDLPGKN